MRLRRTWGAAAKRGDTMDIFANHAHVFPQGFRDRGGVGDLLGVMEKTGISRAVCFAPFHAFESCENPNRWLAREIAPHKELTGFGVVDTAADDIASQVEEIADLGFPGIKMHPQFQKFRVDGDAAKRVYEKAEALGLFVSFHSGIHWHRIKDSELLLFDEVSHFFPGLRFSLEHVGGYCFFNEAVAVLLNNKNVYAGLTSVFDDDMNRLWYLSPDKMRDLLHLVGARRCVFGLDFPYNQEEKIASAIEHVMSLPIADEDKQGILGGNLMRALGLSGG